MSLKVKGVTIEVLTIRYDYTPNDKLYDGYTYKEDTHLATASRTVDGLSQVRGIATVEVIHGRNEQRQTRPLLSIQAKSVYYLRPSTS